MRKSALGTFLLVSLPLMAACDGQYVTYTGNFSVDEQISIRHTGPYSVTKVVSHQTFADMIDDIPDDAIIEKVTITALAADLDILPSTTAQSVDIALTTSEDGFPLEALSFSKSVNVAAAQAFLALALLADESKQEKLNNIRNRINENLATREPWAGLTVGLAGTAHGGTLDANARVVIKVTVIFQVCENVGSWMMASAMSECDAGLPGDN